MDIWLPETLAPVGTYDLIRLGRTGDGGYMVDPRSVAGSKRLISFGMANDWSFEQGFRDLNAVPVDIFDHTVSADYFFRQAYQLMLRLDRPRLFWDQAKIFLAYRRFFRGAVRHLETPIGYDHAGMKSLNAVIEDLPADARDDLFLSIDIEGWEYRILDQIVAQAPKLQGLTIEFHGLDLHLARVTAFVAALPMYLCHVHANNQAPTDATGLPLVIELSFSRHPPQRPGRPRLPHPDESENSDRLESLAIHFADADSPGGLATA